MRTNFRVIAIVTIAGALLLAPLVAQRSRRFFGFPESPPANAEFVFARRQMIDNAGGWWHDYPDAEEHITQIMQEATGIHLDHSSYRIVPLSSEEVFDRYRRFLGMDRSASVRAQAFC